MNYLIVHFTRRKVNYMAKVFFFNKELNGKPHHVVATASSEVSLHEKNDTNPWGFRRAIEDIATTFARGHGQNELFFTPPKEGEGTPADEKDAEKVRKIFNINVH